MILRDKTFIDRMPEEVWYFIEDPLRMRSWNLRIREIVPASIGERGEGFTYRARYEIGGKESNFEAEIMEYRRPFRFVLHLAGGSLRRGGYIQEIYELSESGGGTLLQHTVEHGHLPEAAGHVHPPPGETGRQEVPAQPEETRRDLARRPGNTVNGNTLP
jgi:carbon monoxide dehydrogenase subunit G